jgi:hypothetical protein
MLSSKNQIFYLIPYPQNPKRVPRAVKIKEFLAARYTILINCWSVSVCLFQQITIFHVPLFHPQVQQLIVLWEKINLKHSITGEQGNGSSMIFTKALHALQGKPECLLFRFLLFLSMQRCHSGGHSKLWWSIYQSAKSAEQRIICCLYIKIVRILKLCAICTMQHG